MSMWPKTLLARRSRWIGSNVLPFLQAGDRVLDFGCGDMSVAKYLADHRAISVTGTDLFDHRSVETKCLEFVPHKGGGVLPFEDGEFDVVLVCFVLHHMSKVAQEQYLREMRRISKRAVLVVEDTYVTPWQRLVLCAHDFIGNKLDSWAIPVPCTFRTILDWQGLFASIGWRVRTNPLASMFFGVQHVMFTLAPR